MWFLELCFDSREAERGIQLRPATRCPDRQPASSCRASVPRDASGTGPGTELTQLEDTGTAFALSVITLGGLEKNFDSPNLDGDGEFPKLVEAAVSLNPPGSDIPGARQDVIHKLFDNADIEGRRALAIVCMWQWAIAVKGQLVGDAGLTVEQP